MHIKGTVRQVTENSPWLDWQVPVRWTGNEVKRTSLAAIDAPLDTSRLHISLPTAGAEPYFVDEKPHTANTGDFFVFMKGQEARAVGSFKENVEGYCFFLEEKTLQDAAFGASQPLELALDEVGFGHAWQLPQLPTRSYSLLENPLGQALTTLRESLRSANGGCAVDWSATYFNLATAYLRTCGEVSGQFAAIAASRLSTRLEIHRRLGIAHSYLLENYGSAPSLDELAQVSMLSKFHLLRLYREVYRCTPHQHLMQLRLEQAKVLLKKGLPPSEVALQLSFSDRRAFTKAFRNGTGVSPSEWVFGTINHGDLRKNNQRLSGRKN